MAFLIVVLLIVVAIYIYFQQPQFGKAPSGERLARIEKSPHYRNGAFQNLTHTPNFSNGGNYFKAFKEAIFIKSEHSSPKDSVPYIQTDIIHLPISENVLVWFGHSSYYMQLDGKRILVDPVFSGNASPLSFTVKAFPGSNGYDVEDLPTIDYLFLTHDHWDHLDYKTIVKLRGKVGKVICPLGVGSHLEYWGYDPAIIFENDWGDTLNLDTGFVVHTTPARHFSGRTFKRNNTLWASYVLQSPGTKVFIGGDSGYGNHFAVIGAKHGPFDLAILENGQYNTLWENIHLMPEHFLRAAQDLNANTVLPVHNSKFSLANHAWNEPLQAVVDENKNQQLLLLTPKIGEAVRLGDSTQTFTNWWSLTN